MMTGGTGMPRTGTSMMMQMLLAAGIQPFCDDAREADEHNPRGYFEHSEIKGKNYDWVNEADGMAAKVICPYIPGMPLRGWRAILMTRPTAETMASQDHLIGDAPYNFNLKSLWGAIEKTVAQAKTHMTEAGIAYLPVAYHEAIHSPDQTAAIVRNFIEVSPKMDAAFAAAIDPEMNHFS